MSETFTGVRVNAQDQENANPALGRDEIGLIDVVGFLWRFWRSVVAGALFGAVTGILIWFAKIPGKNSFSHNHLVEARLPILSKSDSELLLVPSILTDFLAQPAGTEAIYNGLKSSAHGKSLNFDSLQTRQRVGKGFIRSISLDGHSLVVVVDATDGWSRDLLLEALPLSLNAAIDSNNNLDAQFREKKELISAEVLRLQNQMAVVKLTAVQLFEEHAALSEPSRQAVLSGITGDLAKNFSWDSLVFLLGAVPDSIPAKKATVKTYNELFSIYEENQLRLKNLMSSYDGFKVRQIPRLGAVADLRILTDTVATGFGQSVSSFVLFAFLGGMFGIAGGIFFSLLATSLLKNKKA